MRCEDSSAYVVPACKANTADQENRTDTPERGPCTRRNITEVVLHNSRKIPFYK